MLPYLGNPPVQQKLRYLSRQRVDPIVRHERQVRQGPAGQSSQLQEWRIGRNVSRSAQIRQAPSIYPDLGFS
jgi:hypothetical protein